MEIKYNNTSVRRQNRVLSYHDAQNLLISGEYGILSFATAAGGYGIPLNYVYDGGSVYFHCAPEGRKIEELGNDNRVSFTIVGKTDVRAEHFTTGYESIIIFGKILIIDNPEEKEQALIKLVKKYSPDYAEKGLSYIKNSFHRTAVLRLDIDCFSGKTKK